jgi:dihydrofolate synthase/folylpolyglutamate synthase
MHDHPLLEVLSKAGMKMGLTRVNSFLNSLQNPHLAYPVLHIAGTNGKGSVCRMAGAILEQAGYKVGITTSPHLQEVNERIRIGATPISDENLDSLLKKLDKARMEWAGTELGPYPLTYFEFSTIAAFQHFADEKVDVAIVEVGMGGRLDATNVVSPLLTAIVTIGLDHTEHLGPDHSSIAAEKAGIIKNNIPVVVGPLPPPALKVIRAVAAERQAPMSIFGEHFEVAGQYEAFRYQSRNRELENLKLVLKGDHQLINAAVALRLVELLPPNLSVSESAIRTGLAHAYNRGRMEWLAEDLLVDGAHNPEGARVLANYLAQLPRDRRRTLVLGGGTDKDIRSVAVVLSPQVDQIIATASSHPKALSPAAIAAELGQTTKTILVAESLDHALKLARNGEDLVIVAGSLYLVGDVRSRVLQ